jgi:hypothetical protein
MRIVRSVLRAGFGFVIGDDWKIFAAVVAALGSGLLLLVAGFMATVAAVIAGLLVGILFATAMIIDVHRGPRRPPGPKPAASINEG